MLRAISILVFTIIDLENIRMKKRRKKTWPTHLLDIIDLLSWDVWREKVTIIGTKRDSIWSETFDMIGKDWWISSMEIWEVVTNEKKKRFFFFEIFGRSME
jgi:hypothetical protein